MVAGAMLVAGAVRVRVWVQCSLIIDVRTICTLLYFRGVVVF